jgi:hypothetical protein
MSALTSHLILIIEEGVMPLLLLRQSRVLFLIFLHFHTLFHAYRIIFLHLVLLYLHDIFKALALLAHPLACLWSVTQPFHEICPRLFVFFNDKPYRRRINMQLSPSL